MTTPTFLTYDQIAAWLPLVAGAGALLLAGLLWAGARAIRALTLDRCIVPVVGLAVAGLGAGALYTSLAKVSALAEARHTPLPWLPGVLIDGAIVTATVIDLALAPQGKRAVWMERLQWVLILCTVALNVYGEDLFGVILHGPQPLIAKAAVAGLKTLIIARASTVIAERIPPLRWLQAPAGTFWIWRQMVLGRVRSYAEALELDGQVAALQIEARAAAGVSARQRVLYRALTGADVPVVVAWPPPGERRGLRLRRRPALTAATVQPEPMPEPAPHFEIVAAEPAPAQATPASRPAARQPGPARRPRTRHPRPSTRAVDVDLDLVARIRTAAETEGIVPADRSQRAWLDHLRNQPQGGAHWSKVAAALRHLEEHREETHAPPPA